MNRENVKFSSKILEAILKNLSNYAVNRANTVLYIFVVLYTQSMIYVTCDACKAHFAFLLPYFNGDEKVFICHRF